MPTLPERYADLTNLASHDDGDLALIRLVGALDQTLQPHPAPPELHTSLERTLSRRIAALPPARKAAHNGTPTPRTLSRREALKAGAASMAFLLALGQTGPERAAELVHFAQAQAREGPMTSARLAGILQTERARWNALLAQVSPDRMEEPGVEGSWSVKEIVAHLSWYEERVVEGARQVLNTGEYTKSDSGLAALSLDERNARIAEQSRARPVGDVLAEAGRVFGQLVALVAACPEDYLNNPHYLGLSDDVAPWILVANNAYAHYREHEQSIRAWLAKGHPPTSAP